MSTTLFDIFKIKEIVEIDNSRFLYDGEEHTLANELIYWIDKPFTCGDINTVYGPIAFIQRFCEATCVDIDVSFFKNGNGIYHLYARRAVVGFKKLMEKYDIKWNTIIYCVSLCMERTVYSNDEKFVNNVLHTLLHLYHKKQCDVAFCDIVGMWLCNKPGIKPWGKRFNAPWKYEDFINCKFL